jgi:hypothetical protein
MSLLGSNKADAVADAPPLALVATTRAQTRRKHLEDSLTHQREQASGTVASNIDDRDRREEVETQPGMLFDFDTTLFSESRDKSRLTRSLKRRGRREHATRGLENRDTDTPAPLDLSAKELAGLQYRLRTLL